MRAEDDVDDLVRAVQSAALDPTRWEPALNAVNAFVKGDGAVLLSVHARQRISPTSTDLAEMIEDYFGLGWHARDAREPCIPLLKARGIAFDYEFQSLEEIDRSCFYNDFLARHRRKWFVGLGASVDGDDWCLSLQRAPDRDPFTTRDLTKLKLVRGLLCNAALLSASLGRSWIAGLHQALHAMAQPALIFDSNARVLDVNDLAVPIVGPYVEDRFVKFDDDRSTRAFYAILTGALQITEPGLDGASCTIRIGDVDCACHATSLLRHESLIATNAAALVILKPTSTGRAQVLKRTFALTDAEARIAVSMSKGRSVRQIAEEHRVKTDTVRSQLKSIYQKVGISSQAQLVAFVRDLPLA